VELLDSYGKIMIQNQKQVQEKVLKNILSGSTDDIEVKPLGRRLSFNIDTQNEK
jgi:hypothetical protein